jgi:hypothetical protein
MAWQHLQHEMAHYTGDCAHAVAAVVGAAAGIGPCWLSIMVECHCFNISHAYAVLLVLIALHRGLLRC